MKTASRLISALFTPLFVPTIVCALTVYAHQYAFGGLKFGIFFILQIMIWTLLIPSISLAIMKNMGMISSIGLADRQERIIPYFLLLSCYSIAFYSISKIEIPFVVKAMVAGFILAVVFGLFLNNFFKISAHAIGMGTLFGASIGLVWLSVANLDWLLVCILILSAFVLSARVYLQLHTNREVFSGFFVGFTSQLITILLYIAVLGA